MIVVSTEDAFVNLNNGKVIIKYQGNVYFVSEDLGQEGLLVEGIRLKWSTRNGSTVVTTEREQIG